MNEMITVEELEKASHNVQRLAEFIGERRDWILASDADEAALSLAEAARSLTAVIARLSISISCDSDSIEARQPAKLDPSGRVTGARLIKFADFINQLREWFSAHDGAALPEGSDRTVHSIQASLAGAIAAIDQLRGPAAISPEPEPDPLASGDLGPVANIDMTARLVLEDTAARPILQVSRGVTELTPEAMTMVDEFFAKQGIELKDAERRRFQDKALRWIQGTPDGQVLVVRLSGLSGKAEAYSSYRPKGS